METKHIPGELTVKHFWDLANALPTETHTNKLLRSHYLTVCKRIARKDGKLPAMKFASSVMCPKCSSVWSKSRFSLKLKPQRFRTNKAQKLVDTLNSDKKSLTRKQKKRAKWLKKRIASSIEIKCEFCQKKLLQPLLMSRKPKIEEVPENSVEPIEATIKKKKKKKAKDKMAGLKLEKRVPNEAKANPFKKEVQQKKVKRKPAKGNVEKVVSNTQKLNSLLQLANMLKNRGQTVTPGGNNQLEKLLR